MTQQYLSNIKAELLLGSHHSEVPSAKIFTFRIKNFPKVLLAELNTHSLLRRNVASSRAMSYIGRSAYTIKKPYIPDWTVERRGMVGDVMPSGWRRKAATLIYRSSMYSQYLFGSMLRRIGVHKQDNRLLESYSGCTVILTGTEWDNFIKLRLSREAQIPLQVLAGQIDQIIRTADTQELKPGEWHIPFIKDNEQDIGLLD